MNNESLHQKPKSEVFLIIKNTLILFAITAVAGLLLSVVNGMTATAIAEQKIIRRDNALNAVLPDSAFSEIAINKAEQYPKITGIFEAKDGQNNTKGYAFMLVSKGYGGAITLVAGIDAQGNITGIDVVNHSETPGLGANADNDNFKDKLKNKKASLLTVAKGNNDGQNVEALSGATITTTAVVDAVNEAIAYYDEELEGGK